MSNEASILAHENLEAIRRHMQSVGFVSVLHWHLFGAQHPTPLAFSDFEDFEQYMKNHSRPGDAFDVWPFPTSSAERIAKGNVPELDGSVPQGGAY